MGCGPGFSLLVKGPVIGRAFLPVFWTDLIFLSNGDVTSYSEGSNQTQTCNTGYRGPPGLARRAEGRKSVSLLKD